MSGLRNRILYIYAIGFGSGLSPKAPGTVGTLPALPMAFLLSYLDLGLQQLSYLLLLIISIIAADIAGRQLFDHDHKSIVCDEMIGILPPLLYFPIKWWLAIFILFRFFDILKPWPICYIDQHVKGPVGCIVDDLLAGLFVFPCLYWL